MFQVSSAEPVNSAKTDQSTEDGSRRESAIHLPCILSSKLGKGRSIGVRKLFSAINYGQDHDFLLRTVGESFSIDYIYVLHSGSLAGFSGGFIPFRAIPMQTQNEGVFSW
ncbi:hypothetical protein A6X21_16495 [Planctopirus hydrillae]|uniref:Uncharacterized protein n=1 Tax=Planctopirus hydrillae TaxID=1841610 RepID=A0A1C3ESW0_9PLAN|nr:hypothetical protein A6X21_16495 [Planctopirus hydrillae]